MANKLLFIGVPRRLNFFLLPAAVVYRSSGAV